MSNHKTANILQNLAERLVNAASSVHAGADRLLAIAHTETQLGRKLTDSEYDNAFNQSKKSLQEEVL